MPIRWSPREHLVLVGYFLKWLLIAGTVAGIVGSAVAFFLWILDLATRARWDHPWLLFLLPLAGLAIGLLYHFLGKSAEGGNNLIMEQIHRPGGGVPLRMAPLVLVGTVITHLFGGSAGREGTAVQMGGSIAGTVCRMFRLKRADCRVLLMTGVAAGFGAVFGTPLTGAIFAIEVLSIGRMSYDALIPCLIASVIADQVTIRWGIQHAHYFISNAAQHAPRVEADTFSVLLAAKVAVAAVAFGLVSVLFAQLSHGVSHLFKKTIHWPPLRPAIGGLVVIALVFVVGTRDYLGLGVMADPHAPVGVSIVSSFQPGGATALSWWWKILFTAITIGSGFKGGEVTPLFFVGASLGNAMARLLRAPVDLFAGLGFVAVFAGATNTPLACTMMGIELFTPVNGALASGGFVVYVAIACCLAYLVSGRSSIYTTQRFSREAFEGSETENVSPLTAEAVRLVGK